MPVISPYGNPQDCGALELTPLHTPVAHRPDEAVTDEVNSRGAYVHVISRSSTASSNANLIRQQLRKLAERTIPTPATMVGVGFHRLYNHDGWAGASGLVFSPATTSLISYKGSIGSYRLSHLPRLPVDDAAAQSQTLRQAFNRLGDTVSTLHPSRPRKLHLTEDVVLAAKKYEELAVRATGHHCPASTVQTPCDDVSSKFIIARHVAHHKPADQWSKAELLNALAVAAQPAPHRPPGLPQLLGHARLKIEKFTDDAAIQNYLRKGAATPSKVNAYKNLIAREGVLPPNEHLLMPSMNDVLGVYVDLDSVRGVDHAFQVMTELHQHAASSARDPVPALSYRLSQKTEHALAMHRWTNELRPWTTEALLDFAKTGTIGDGDHRAVPDHFLLILAVAHHGALVGEQKESRADGTTGTRDFIADLSGVSENRKNLLELLIAHRNDVASIEAARFFCLWRVPVHDAGKTTSALTAARACNHPALALLEEMASLTPAGREAQRQSMIRDHLDHLLRRKPITTTYTMRSGITESGKVAYIPQLQTCRVIDGSSVPTDAAAPAYTGLRSYDPARAAMIQCAGSRRTRDGCTELGLWHVDARDANAEEMLSLGVRFQTVQASGGIQTHHIDFVSTLPDHAVRIGLRVTDTRSDGDAVLVTLTAALGRDAIDGSTVADAGCTSFKMNHFLPRLAVASFLERANGNALFNDLPFSFDPAQRTHSSLVKHAENHVRYRLVHQRFLQRWQAAMESAAVDDGEVGKVLIAALERNAVTLDVLENQIEMGRDALRETLLQSYDDIRGTLARRDAYGECLLDYLVPLFRSSTSAQDAPLQCLLGASFASGCGDVKADATLAIAFFEKAARHAQRGSYAGLGKLYEEGQAGLAVDISVALDTYQNGAARGDDAALAALTALATRLAAERETALRRSDELAQCLRGNQAEHLHDQEQAAARQAVQNGAAHDATPRAEAPQRAAEEQLAATRSNSVRVSGFGRMRALFRGGRRANRR